jgi:hypothetical protein
MTAAWPAGDPRDVARAIVAEPRFRGRTAVAAPGPGIVERILTWIGDRLHGLGHAIGHVLGPASPLGTLIMVLVLLAIVAGAIVLIVRFFRLPSRSHAAGTRRPIVALEREYTSAQLLALARRYASDERWHDAASAFVRAALVALDETGRLRFDPARTAGEARRLLRDPGFDAFEREATTALFGDGAATADRIARLRAAYTDAFGVPA